jgi:hypothetical protein
MSQWTKKILVLLATIFLLLHLPFLPSVPASIDSVNFLLGLDHYSVADHQPHPPGAPLFIVLGRLSNSLFAPFFADNAIENGVRALAIWGVLLGACATFPLFIFFRGLEGNDRRAMAATAVTLSCPLLWFSASRPMSDVAGLVSAVTVQALLMTVLRWSSDDARSAGVLRVAAFIAGLVIGIRVQTVWLTLPMLLCAAAYARLPWRSLAQVALAFLIGVFVWLAPLITVSGGWTQYVRAFATQASDDWGGADILATNLSIDQALQVFIHTFAYPWTELLLAATVMALAVAGLAAMLARSSTGVMLLALGSVPYAAFHLLFQETVNTRYALPLIPAVAYLAVRGVDGLSTRSMPLIAAALSLTGIILASPSAVAHARTPGPVFLALDDLRQASPHSARPALAMHHAVTRMLRGQDLPVRALPSPRPKYEWLELVKHWKRSPDTPVWFLAETGRTDFALIDPRSRRLVGSYAWSFPRKFVMSRVPATNLDWFEMRPPAWMVGEGWSLSHEAAGLATARGSSIGERPLRAFLRSRPEATVLMIGGRVLHAPGAGPVRFTASLHGEPLASWDVQRDEPSFLRLWRLPAGRLVGPPAYIPMDLTAASHPNARHPDAGAASGAPAAAALGAPAVAGSTNVQDLDVRISQFDFQSDESVVYGFGSGWYQSEFDGVAPRPWRWTGASANLQVHALEKNLVLHLVAEVPIKYLRGPAQISVHAGSRLLGSAIAREEELDLTVPIPAQALADAAGVITIQIDRTFVPHDIMGNDDRRQLGLRAYQVDLREDTTPDAKTRQLHARGQVESVGR